MKTEHKAYKRDGMYWCAYCDHGEDYVCGVRIESGMGCTREIGHKGDHVACGCAEPSPNHTHAVWPREEKA